MRKPSGVDISQIMRDGAWGRLQGLRHAVQTMVDELNSVHDLFGIPRWTVLENHASGADQVVIPEAVQTRERRAPRDFTDEFKAKVVAEAENGSIYETARKYDISYSVVVGWVKKAKQAPKSSSKSSYKQTKARREHAAKMRLRLAKMLREFKRLGGTGRFSNEALEKLRAEKTNKPRSGD